MFSAAALSMGACSWFTLSTLERSLGSIGHGVGGPGGAPKHIPEEEGGITPWGGGGGGGGVILELTRGDKWLGGVYLRCGGQHC